MGWVGGEGERERERRRGKGEEKEGWFETWQYAVGFGLVVWKVGVEWCGVCECVDVCWVRVKG